MFSDCNIRIIAMISKCLSLFLGAGCKYFFDNTYVGIREKCRPRIPIIAEVHQRINLKGETDFSFEIMT